MNQIWIPFTGSHETRITVTIDCHYATSKKKMNLKITTLDVSEDIQQNGI